MYQKIYLNDWLTGLKSSCCTLIGKRAVRTVLTK